MGLGAALRPEPKCRHNNPRGFCTTCDGNTSDRIPTGTFRGKSGGRLVRKKK